MRMKQTLDVINQMEADGIIGRYAIAGAVAAYNYIEPTLTEDLDLLIPIDQEIGRPQSGLITLSPLFSYLKARGYEQHRNEGLVIEGWPVQFLPVADELDAEALARADDVEIASPNTHDAVRTRVLRPEHLVAIALRIGRPKDRIRIAQFLEGKAVNLGLLAGVLERHKLMEAWRSYCRQTGIADPLAVKRRP
jgi:hypothetical protein